jgi:hypothetical protein
VLPLLKGWIVTNASDVRRNKSRTDIRVLSVFFIFSS